METKFNWRYGHKTDCPFQIGLFLPLPISNNLSINQQQHNNNDDWRKMNKTPCS